MVVDLFLPSVEPHLGQRTHYSSIGRPFMVSSTAEVAIIDCDSQQFKDVMVCAFRS